MPVRLIRGLLTAIPCIALSAAFLPGAAALDAPADLQHKLATAQTGDVFDISSFCYSVPYLPQVAVTRTWSGGTLVFSDSPEYVPGPSIVYADTLPVGPARLFVYHVNDSANSGTRAQDLKFTVIVEPANAGDRPTLTVKRRMIAGPSQDYMAVGIQAAHDLLSVAETPSSRTITAPTVLDSALESHVVPALSYPSLIEALYDVEVAGAPLKFAIAAVGRHDDSLSLYKTLPRVARTETSPGVYANDRGTFLNSAEKTVSMASGRYYTTAGMMHIRAGGGVSDEYGADAWAGEGGSTGTDAILGIPSVLRGNYGVVYRFNVPVSSPDGRRIAVLLNPWGGSVTAAVNTGASLTGEGTFYAPAGGGVLDPISKVTLVGRWNPAVTPTISFSWSPPGSTSLPVEFVLVPYPEPGDVSANGVIDLTDAARALRFAIGVATPSAKQVIAADVTPTDQPDGLVTMDDVVWILERCGGLK